ncbi:MAG: alpha/beta hydrolase [Patescibacteria group bacterium]
MQTAIQPTPKKMKLWRKIVLTLITLLLIAVISFVIWAKQIYKADQTKLQEFLNTNKDLITVTEHPKYWEIAPNATTSTKGVIYYPGAKVDPQAYFYKLESIVTSTSSPSILFVTKPPLNLAIFSIGQAGKIIDTHPEIKTWTLGGHSMGGAMACEYAKNHAEKFETLLLVGTYCNSDVSSKNFKVVNIHGSLDGVLTPEKLSAYSSNLPTSQRDFPIEGMNHAQAGNYGNQKGDLMPTKSDEDVKKEIEMILNSEV